MKVQSTYAALSLVIVLTAAGCPKPDPVPVPIGDYCTIASPPRLSDGCAFGEAPEMGADGFPTCSALTLRDLRVLAAEVNKYLGRCEASP